MSLECQPCECSTFAPKKNGNAAPVAAISGIKQSKLDLKAAITTEHALHVDTFVVGKSNEFAHAASRAVAEQPSKGTTRCFVCGVEWQDALDACNRAHHQQRNPAAR